MASRSGSLYSWPPNPNLTSFHFLVRCVTIFSNAIGIGLCFAAAARSSYVSVWVGGSFMSSSMLIEPIFIIWNARQLRRHRFTRSTRSHNGVSGYERLGNVDQTEEDERPMGMKFLKFAALLDVAAFVAYVIVYGYAVHDATRWGYVSADETTLLAYASASILVCVVLHGMLAITQCLQISSAYTRESNNLRCPHCNHRMGSMPSLATEAVEPPAAQGQPPQGEPESTENLLTQVLVDTDPDAVPVTGMAPGQTTGTCQATPRVSQSSRGRADSSTTAIDGEGMQEHDRLIEKSK